MDRSSFEKALSISDGLSGIGTLVWPAQPAATHADTALVAELSAHQVVGTLMGFRE
jgi:hypothetical protein